MALTSQIVEYTNQWSDMFIAEKTRLITVFGPKIIRIHHIGSTAIPGIAAKPEIDILVEVSDHEDENNIVHKMAVLGYIKGKDLSEGHHFYRRDVNGIRTHKVHVCLTGHTEIFRMILFRDILRQDSILRQQYQNLKLELESTNKFGIKEYLEKKAPFINEVIDSTLKAKQ
ncbi:GrpB family protein [Dickeya poaceiphila]|uniref:GrpB family protein n=1 Tax=Dickeya poaceiphila TaxID=568768 RepID=A0A5B8I3J8_9GAMM|nr:GrpB family protein [Dickeya poaceiphila]QDX29264.1 GrpB family protein [Dickeya poaceiphila]